MGSVRSCSGVYKVWRELGSWDGHSTYFSVFYFLCWGKAGVGGSSVKSFVILRFGGTYTFLGRREIWAVRWRISPGCFLHSFFSRSSFV